MSETMSGDRADRLQVRVIHSQASTGATCFTRVLASLPDVFLLNEVSPAGYKLAQTRFNAMDPLEQLFARRDGSFSLSADEHIDLFAARLRPVIDHCRAHGKTLLIRDHSHSDYFMDGADMAPSLPKVLDWFGDEIEMRAVVMVRYPLASFMTAKASSFLNHIPHFQNYCTRYARFIQDYEKVPRIRYEDFTENPQITLEKLCQTFGLTFAPEALRTFNQITLSGSSGRYGKDRMIHPTLMRDFGTVLRDIAQSAPAAQMLCNWLSYPRDPAEFARNSAERMLRFDPNSVAAQEAHEKWSAVLASAAAQKEVTT